MPAPTKPTTIPAWATSAGSSIVSGLTITAATWQQNITEGRVTYGLIRYQCNAANLSAVLPGHKLTVTGFTNADNNGDNIAIYQANDTDNWIETKSTLRITNSLDETGASGSGAVTDTGALRLMPSTSKNALGFLTPEKPPDGWFNFLFYWIGRWIQFVSDWVDWANSEDSGFINSESPGIPWTEITASQNAVVNNGYITNGSAGRIDITLPATAAQGSILEIVNKGAGFSLLCDSQTILTADESTTDQITSVSPRGSLRLLATIADTTFTVLNQQGDFQFGPWLGYAGYWLGGFASFHTDINKITYSTESITNISTDLTTATYNQSGGSQSQATRYGYTFGGIDSGATSHNWTGRLIFSTESWTQSVAALSQICNAGATVESSTHAYVTLGSFATVVDKFNLSTESYESFSNTMPNRVQLGACNSADAGYFAGGSEPTDEIKKLLFSSGAITTISAVLTSTTNGPSKDSPHNSDAGYFCGDANGPSTDVDKLTFTTETIAASTALITAMSWPTAAHSLLAGYVATSNSSNANCDKILFSNDTTSAIGVNPMSPGRGNATAMTDI